jgi:hypothetical protein
MRKFSNINKRNKFNLFFWIIESFFNFYAILGIVLIVGWIMNVIDLIGMPINPITMEIILRLLGLIFVPLGSFMGIIY